MRSITVQAPAKVNLFLGVGSRRADGYHDVETVLHTLELADTVTLTPADELTVRCDADLGTPAEDNLAFRAARAFSAAFDVDVLLDIEVAKAIPAGAGLGGGSSDAAAVLAGLAYWAGLGLSDARLLAVGASLGADVPFFLTGGAVLMRGRGDEFVRALPSTDAHVVIAKPPGVVPTVDAYRAFDAAPAAPGEPEAVCDALEARDVEALGCALANNMTASSAGLVPEIAEALAWLRAADGVLGAAMAGSGSAVYALCRDASVSLGLEAEARWRGWWSAATRLAPGGARVVDSGGVL